MAAGRSSTGISPRPMLMGAAHDALWASNARVSLSCLCVLAHRLPRLLCGLVLSLACLAGVPSCGLATGSWRTGRIGSTQTESYPSALYCAGGLPPGFLCQGAIQGRRMERGKHAAPGPGSAQVKIQDGDNQLRFQPPAQIFIHLGMRKAVKRHSLSSWTAQRCSRNSAGLPGLPLRGSPRTAAAITG